MFLWNWKLKNLHVPLELQITIISSALAAAQSAALPTASGVVAHQPAHTSTVAATVVQALSPSQQATQCAAIEAAVVCVSFLRSNRVAHFHSSCIAAISAAFRPTLSEPFLTVGSSHEATHTATQRVQTQ
mmetsp:Transcript_22598/g.32484  ORF Transcript_22598/g.32484 Transcript_22598/m.32484 type:complete len:130 (+) Transcript_22598:150-539(+)